MATTASGGASGTAYEEQRRKRVLENLKHLEVTRHFLSSPLLEAGHGRRNFIRPSMDPLPAPPFFRSTPPIRAASSIDQLVLLTHVPGSFPQELGIKEMSKSLLQAARLQNKNKGGVRASPKPRKKFDATEVRRSSRAKATVSYKEDFGELDTFLRHKRRTGKGAEQGREYTGRVASYEQQQRAFKRAEKLQDSLDPENPSFVKAMVRSHVSSCFWLGLPSSFCKNHLPSKEFRMVLEDEEGGEFDAVYIGNRTGLSGGWRGFAMHHNLEDGDSLVFELIEPDRFKIYIMKAIEDDVVGEAGSDDNAGEDTKDEPQDDSPAAEPPKGAKRRKLRGRR
ncbi:hypothetical protein EJB05_36140, partial [Eragrostis curvula]